MKFTPMAIPAVILVTPRVFTDERGFFMESYHAAKYAAGGIATPFVQDNLSQSQKGVLRGLHYQIQQPQGKLVQVIEGAVFDVAVDLRRSSPTCGQWVGQRLDSEKREMLWVPPGFGHGYLVLSEQVILAYKCTDLYAPAHERTIRWNDPTLGIHWPLEPGRQPILSDKDRAGVALGDAELYP